MIDRIGELLAEPAEEEDGEEREDALALTPEKVAQASPRGDGEKTGEVGTDDDRSGGRTAEKRGAVVSSGLSSERSKSGEAPRGRTAFAQSESLGRVANRRSVTTGEILPERPGRMSGRAGDGGVEDRSGGRTAEDVIRDRPGRMAGETGAEVAEELWKAGPVWTVRSAEPETDRVRGTAAVERTDRTEEALPQMRAGASALTGLARAARGGAAGLPPEGAGRSGTARAGQEQTGLEGLYRQSVGGLRPAAPALPPVQAGRTARAPEPTGAAPLAVDELDRAVRRDSRRYDGGMSIY